MPARVEYVRCGQKNCAFSRLALRDGQNRDWLVPIFVPVDFYCLNPKKPNGCTPMVHEYFEIQRLTDAARLDELLPVFSEYRKFYKLKGELKKERVFLMERLERQDSILLAGISSATGAVAGFTQLYHSFSSLKMAPFLVLNDLFVAEAHRRQGLAKMLIEEAQQTAKALGACGMMLDTSKQNIPGKTLYELTGFKANTGSDYYYWFSEGGYVG